MPPLAGLDRAASVAPFRAVVIVLGCVKSSSRFGVMWKLDAAAELASRPPYAALPGGPDLDSSPVGWEIMCRVERCVNSTFDPLMPTS